MARTHPLQHLETVLIVGIGGFAGSNLRYVVDLFVPSSLLATATVNVLGCAALGFFLYSELYGDALSTAGRSVLATGFVASFTTYSTFVVDAVTAAHVTAIGYVVGSYVAGFAGVLVGRAAARRVVDRVGTPPEVEE